MDAYPDFDCDQIKHGSSVLILGPHYSKKSTLMFNIAHKIKGRYDVIIGFSKFQFARERMQAHGIPAFDLDSFDTDLLQNLATCRDKNLLIIFEGDDLSRGHVGNFRERLRDCFWNRKSLRLTLLISLQRDDTWRLDPHHDFIFVNSLVLCNNAKPFDALMKHFPQMDGTHFKKIIKRCDDTHFIGLDIVHNQVQKQVYKISSLKQ